MILRYKILKLLLRDFNIRLYSLVYISAFEKSFHQHLVHICGDTDRFFWYICIGH